MDLNKLKEQINKLNFPAESLQKLNEILDQAIKEGSMSEENKQKLLAVIDMEIAAANIEADAFEEVALALDSYVNDVDKSGDIANQEIDELEESFKSETD